MLDLFRSLNWVVKENIDNKKDVLDFWPFVCIFMVDETFIRKEERGQDVCYGSSESRPAPK